MGKISPETLSRLFPADWERTYLWEILDCQGMVPDTLVGDPAGDPGQRPAVSPAIRATPFFATFRMATEGSLYISSSTTPRGCFTQEWDLEEGPGLSYCFHQPVQPCFLGLPNSASSIPFQLQAMTTPPTVSLPRQLSWRTRAIKPSTWRTPPSTWMPSAEREPGVVREYSFSA